MRARAMPRPPETAKTTGVPISLVTLVSTGAIWQAMDTARGSRKEIAKCLLRRLVSLNDESRLFKKLETVDEH